MANIYLDGQTFEFAVDPTVNDDETEGYRRGHRWINTSTDNVFECTNPATGAAVWLDITNQDNLDSHITNLANPHQTTAVQVGAIPFSGNILVSGSVSWDSGLTYDVSDLEYVIQGTTYTAVATQVTLNAADPSLPRVDVIYADSNGNIGVLIGTPAPAPVKPNIDSDTQLELTDIRVEAGATEPGDVSCQDIYLENTEWTATENTSGVNINLSSTNDPYTGSVSIETTNIEKNHYIDFEPAMDESIAAADLLQFAIKLKTSWLNNIGGKFAIAFFRDGNRIGDFVTLKHGDFGFDHTDPNYQIIAIDKAFFRITDTIVDRVRFLWKADDSDCFIDRIRLQCGVHTNGDVGDTGLAVHLASTNPHNITPAMIGAQPLSAGNQVITGTAVWYAGLIYNVTALQYRIDGEIYNSAATQITLSAADPTHPRIDVIYADDSQTVGFLTGTPSANPVAPEVDDLTQVEILQVRISAGATQPDGVSVTVIYLENSGEPSEWTATPSNARISTNETTDPYEGSIHIEVLSGKSGDKVTFTTSTPVNFADFPILDFYIKPLPPWDAGLDKDLRIQLKEGGSNNGISLRMDTGDYGFDAGDPTYQNIQIPRADFVTTRPLVDEIEFKNDDDKVVYRMDRVRFSSATGGGTGNVTGPESSNNNAIAVFDGVSGNQIKNSLAQVDASGNITTPGLIDGRDVSVDGAKLDTLGVAQKDEFVPTLGQVTFILSSAPVDVTSVTVHVNGIEADEGVDYTLSGVTMTWLNASFSMETDDLVVVRYH